MVETRKLESAWDFVERYFPQYTSSEVIAENNDLQVIVDGEIQPDSCALQLYESIEAELKRGQGNEPGITDPSEDDIFLEAADRLDQSTKEIYETAILGYIAGVDNWR